MLSGCVDEVNKLGAGIRFIPAEMAWYHHIKIDGTQTFHLVTDKSSSLFGFSTDIARYVIHSNTVVYTAMQIAYYMGIREMVLIGVDHSFHVSKNDAGEIIVDPNAKDYFSESYNMDKEKLYIPNLDASTRTYLSAKQHAQKLGFCIYNATRGGKLEVFPRVELDSLFYGKQY